MDLKLALMLRDVGQKAESAYLGESKRLDYMFASLDTLDYLGNKIDAEKDFVHTRSVR